MMLGIRMRRCVVAGIVGVLAAGADSAHAMQFHAVPIDDKGTVAIQAEGEIIPGDTGRLRTLIANLPATVTILGFTLDSPGGNLLEAEQLAPLIHRAQTNVVVLGGARCVSACFLLFAAGAGRFVAPDALIGVHSASDAGKETPMSMVATTAMARDAAILGVPPAIIGKMVSAEPGQMDWLTRDDLAAMNVVVLQPQPSAQPTHTAPAAPSVAMSSPTPPAVNDNTTASAPPTPAPTQPDTTASPTQSSFDQGLADRKVWEAWYAGLTGDYQQGAEWWSARRSLPNPPSCGNPATPAQRDWNAGCLAAQQRLAASDVRRTTDPTYRQGWNSY